MDLILKVDHNDLFIISATKQTQQAGRSRKGKMSEEDGTKQAYQEPIQP